MGTRHARRMTEAVIIHRWQLGPWLYLEAGPNAIELVVASRDRSPELDRPHGEHEADAPDISEYEHAMTAAREWRAAVYPVRDSGHSPALRAGAWSVIGDLPRVIATPSLVTELLDYYAAQLDDEAATRDLPTYAAYWYKLRYDRP